MDFHGKFKKIQKNLLNYNSIYNNLSIFNIEESYGFQNL